ncbi:MAG: metal ABC transporter permease [Chloroflexi bacterium]|nr:metal ABC transporter permease [Chloroflexota bacterium]
MSWERLTIDLLLVFFDASALNAFLTDPRSLAILLGALIAISGATLGTFLMLRSLSLTSDAISHTVLFGIVVAFLMLTWLPQAEPSLNSPWLILGAAAAGVLTVLLTELLSRSRVLKQDAALGIIFPLLFAIAIILLARFADDVHLDSDSVMIGEIGLAAANTRAHCIENCVSVEIREDDPAARFERRCINCQELAIYPRDPRAEFVAVCGNCGVLPPAEAWSAGLLEEAPVLVHWPRSLSVISLLTAVTLGAILLFYKELKLSSFDPALARTLGLRPAWLHYGTMVLVSLVAVGAFDAVGSILVVAFFIIPPATAHLISKRLVGILVLAPIFGTIAAWLGYDLARGEVLGLPVSGVISLVNQGFGLDWQTEWNSHISASMVIMMFVMFMLVWLVSPREGLITGIIRRHWQRNLFAEQILLGHIFHHEGTPNAAQELAVATLHQHLRWSPNKLQRVMWRIRAKQQIQVSEELRLTESGRRRVEQFRRELLAPR